MSGPTFAGMRLVAAEELAAALPVGAAAEALERALREGLDPEHDAPRSRVTTPTGQLLLMPSTWAGTTSTKVLTSTTDNASRGLPAIQGVFVLFDGEGQQPVALVDGAALTDLRTPAASLLALRLLDRAEEPMRLALFGSGSQARSHLRALAATGRIREVALVGRRRERLEPLGELAASHGIPAEVHTMADADQVVAGADLICCCTSSPDPLFDGGAVRDHAVVIGMGSHTPDARELDTTLVTRSSVVVESRRSALQEAGDLVIPRREGRLDEAGLVTLSQLATGETTLPLDRPRVFKGTGMPWQDLVVGAAVWRALG